MLNRKVSQVSTSAPGKIILHGEHSVVHGKRAIACAIESRVTVTASLLTEETANISILMTSLHPDRVDISVNELKNVIQDAKTEDVLMSEIEKFSVKSLSGEFSDFMRIALSCLLYAYYKVFLKAESTTKFPAIFIVIESQLPIGAGLGSSAAFSTSVACAFLVISGQVRMPENNKDTSEFFAITGEECLEKINSLAYEMEKIVHKTPSGIDNSIATFGGAVSFQNGVIAKIEKMPKLNLIIVDTKVPRSTKILVAGVKEFLDRFPDVVNPILEAMHNITISAQNILEKLFIAQCNPQLTIDLGKLIVANQCLLSSIGVSHPSLDKVCAIAQKYHFPAKLTGAGGGGCAIILLDAGDQSDENIEKLKQDLKDEGFLTREAVLGGPGVLVKAHPLP